MFDDDRIMIDEWVEEQSSERIMVALQRALKKLNIEYDLGPGGSIEIHADEDEYEDELNEALSHELCVMYVIETRDKLTHMGYLKPVGVDESGEVLYTATDKPFDPDDFESA